MKAIAMFNNKGGVGKTTVLCNLASWLSLNEHKKVLVIDADPQCNTTTYVLDDDEFLNVYYEKNSLCHLFVGYVDCDKGTGTVQFGAKFCPYRFGGGFVAECGTRHCTG